MKLSKLPLISWEMICYKIYLLQFCKCLADNFDNLKFQDASKVAIFRPPNSYILHCHSKSGLFILVTSCIAMVNVVFLLFIWKEMTWKIPNLENLEFYTCTLWAHNAKFLIMAYRRNSWACQMTAFW